MGQWMVTKDEINVTKNMGAVLSSRPAALPSEAGLTFKYPDNSGEWRDASWRLANTLSPTVPASLGEKILAIRPLRPPPQERILQSDAQGNDPDSAYQPVEEG